MSLSINEMLKVILVTMKAGLDKTIAITLLLATCMAGIDFVLSVIYEWSDNMTQFLKLFWKKILNYAFIFALISNWETIFKQAINIAFNFGYIFFPERWKAGLIKVNSAPSTPDLDKIYDTLFQNIIFFGGKVNALTGWKNFGIKLISVLLIVVLMITVFLILKELIIQTVQFYVLSMIGVLLLMFSTFEQTKSVGSKIFTTLLNSLLSLIVTLALTGVGLTATENIVNAIDKTGDAFPFGDMVFYTFLMGIIAYLILCSKEFAQGIMSGNVTASGGSAIMGMIGKAAVGAAGAVAGVAAAIVGIKGALQAAKVAQKEGMSIKGTLKQAAKGYQKSVNAMKNTRLGKLGKAINNGIKATAKVASGQMGIGGLATATLGGLASTIGGQITHDKSKVAQQKDAITDIEDATAGDFVATLNEDELKEAEEKWNEASDNSEIKQNYNSLDEYVQGLQFDKKYAKAQYTNNKTREMKEAREYAYNKAKATGKKDKQSIKNFEKEFLNRKNSSSSSFNNTESNNSNSSDYSASQQTRSQANTSGFSSSSFNNTETNNNNTTNDYSASQQTRSQANTNGFASSSFDNSGSNNSNSENYSASQQTRSQANTGGSSTSNSNNSESNSSNTKDYSASQQARSKSNASGSSTSNSNNTGSNNSNAKDYSASQQARSQAKTNESSSSNSNNTEPNNSNTKDYSADQQEKTNKEFNKYNQKLKDDFDNYQNMYEKEFEKFNQSFKNKGK
ncbi:MAG: type IV secretion system protein [Sneathia sanguinegens]|uniref:type IV secretion system protein n=1 Tax=Sneathia sanguinegens TaxID=40543 RepID=UPI00290FE34A|nr:type IV secretion system protein [Sneathia sanguinegens]MDU4652701.1 type IV secretion system protein [Sneathia sanguinegens]